MRGSGGYGDGVILFSSYTSFLYQAICTRDEPSVNFLPIYRVLRLWSSKIRAEHLIFKKITEVVNFFEKICLKKNGGIKQCPEHGSLNFDHFVMRFNIQVQIYEVL